MEYMNQENRKPRVAFIQDNPRVIADGQPVLEAGGFEVFSWTLHDTIQESREELLHFLDRTEPDLLMVDIAHPFEENWKAFQRLMESPILRQKPWLITTVDRLALTLYSGPVPYVQIRGIPFDHQSLLKAVQAVWQSHGHPALKPLSRWTSALPPNSSVAA